jgi:hypothetical protein
LGGGQPFGSRCRCKGRVTNSGEAGAIPCRGGTDPPRPWRHSVHLDLVACRCFANCEAVDRSERVLSRVVDRGCSAPLALKGFAAAEKLHAEPRPNAHDAHVEAGPAYGPATIRQCPRVGTPDPARKWPTALLSAVDTWRHRSPSRSPTIGPRPLHRSMLKLSRVSRSRWTLSAPPSWSRLRKSIPRAFPVSR